MNSIINSNVKLWKPGDWNALFGFGTNILVNLLVLTGLLRFVLQMPDDIVFGRILPAVGLMMCLSTLYYAYLAYKLAKETGRTDVCALPSGISVPHMFVVVFVIMLPISLTTGDPIKGWEAGLTWVLVQSFVLMIGGYIAPYIRKITPRAALLGTLAGVSIAFISLRPALEMFMTPVIGVVCFAIILLSWFGGVRYFKGIPAGLVAIAVGTLIAWGSTALGLNFGGLSLEKLTQSLTSFGFAVPIPAIGHVFSGFEFIGIILVTAIPFGIYDLVEAMDNVESAAVAGDSYPTTRVLTADGVISLIGCCMGNPSHAPAIIVSLMPHLAAWGKLQIDNVLGAAGTNAAAVGIDKLAQNGVLYEGLSVLGGGAILGGLMLGAITAFIIDRSFIKAGLFACASSVLTFFGLMHGEAIGIAESPTVAFAYLAVAGVLFACAKFSVVSYKAPEAEHEIIEPAH